MSPQCALEQGKWLYVMFVRSVYKVYKLKQSATSIHLYRWLIPPPHTHTVVNMCLVAIVLPCDRLSARVLCAHAMGRTSPRPALTCEVGGIKYPMLGQLWPEQQILRLHASATKHDMHDAHLHITVP